MAGAAREFDNPIQFILTVVGYAVGLGNIWRFPYLVYDNGGGAFIIIFIIILLIIGVPIFMLELGLGQFSGLGPSKVYHRMAPIFQGVGFAALTVQAFIAFYYNVIIAYCLYYLILSMNSKLPWSTCGNSWNTNECLVRNKSIDCSLFNELYPTKTLSPSEEYFYNKILNISSGIGELGEIEYPIALSLLACWIIVFAALAGGISSLGKVAYFTATLPYVILTVLVINGALLDGAKDGVNYYIGSIDVDKFKDPRVWKNAAVQAFYSISACTGGLISMSKFNPFDHNILRDSFIIPLLDCFTGFYAGFAIFTVLGFMFKSKCATDFTSVVTGGPELAFIVYPEGLSYIIVPPLWSILFFLMMLALGFGSQFSITETVMVAFTDVFEKFISTRPRELILRALVCVMFFLLGLTMTTRGGFYVLSLVNEYATGYPILIIGILEVILVGWIYGSDQFVKDMEAMIGKKSKIFWFIMKITWKFIVPAVLVAIIVATAIVDTGKLEIHGSVYPEWAIAIGWIIAMLPILSIVGCAIAQVYIHRSNLKMLITTDPSYYDRSKNYKNSVIDSIVPEDHIYQNESFDQDTRF